jgi:Ca2+-binding RTX toxin-like protein
MADNTYYVEDWLNGSVPFDDGTGTDWIIVRNAYYPALSGATYGAAILMYWEFPDQVTFSVRFASGTVTAGAVLGLIENAQGGEGDELIEGNTAANLIYGDLIDVAGGRDELSGRGGADQLFGAGGSDKLYGGSADDLLFGDIDPFSQDHGNYLAGDDTLYGDDGNDILYGGLGNNVLYGGNDVDTADYSGFFDDFGNTAYRIFATLEAGTVYVLARDTFGGPEVTIAADTVFGVEVIRGTEGGDRIDGRLTFAVNEVKGNSIEGRGGDDSLLGSAGADSLYGGDGNDSLRDYGRTLSGVTAHDLLDGGNGNDIYIIEAASTQVIETATGGFDSVTAYVAGLTLAANVENLVLEIYAGAGNGSGNALANRIDGNSFANGLNGFGGNDTLLGNDGADTLNGGAQKDTLFGGNQADALSGGSQNDDLYGEAGNDSLYGGNENDRLNGGNDNDLVQGGTGRDQLRGGAGQDSFIFAAGDSGTGTRRDLIQDFTTSRDSIDLSQIAGGQTFIADAGFSGVAGQVRYSAITGILSGDTNGDRAADYQIDLGIGTVLVAADLIF